MGTLTYKNVERCLVLASSPTTLAGDERDEYVHLYEHISKHLAYANPDVRDAFEDAIDLPTPTSTPTLLRRAGIIEPFIEWWEGLPRPFTYKDAVWLGTLMRTPHPTPAQIITVQNLLVRAGDDLTDTIETVILGNPTLAQLNTYNAWLGTFPLPHVQPCNTDECRARRIYGEMVEAWEEGRPSSATVGDMKFLQHVQMTSTEDEFPTCRHVYNPDPAVKAITITLEDIRLHFPGHADTVMDMYGLWWHG